MTNAPARTDADGATAGAARRWAALGALFEQALARPPHERPAYLSGAAPDPAARAEVEALLAAHEGRGRLDVLADDVIAPLLAPPALGARFRIVGRLGGGGMGVVYRARDERLDRDVALKFLPPHLSTDAAAKQRFLIEARAAAALEHPNVCTVHEIGETDDGQLYIVMAYYDGETLDRRIAGGPLPVAEALRVAAEVARGLAKAHERGIVHRDVKPANVVVTRDGHVKVLDFGIAKLADAAVTHTGGVVGTVAYMSPEQALGEPVDRRTDVWSLGVVLYEMLTGQRPFGGPGEQAIRYAALTAEPAPAASLRAEVPDALDAILRRALAKRPADRHDGAAELLAELAACPADGPAGARDSALALGGGGERRLVTVLACAVAGYDALFERLPAEDAERVLARLRDAATEAATRHGGIVNHFAGDEFVMLFGVPTAHEDDAVRAARAALALRARVAELAAGLDGRLGGAVRLRAGVHTGGVLAQRLRTGGARFRVTGAPVDVAARLAALAEPDAILLSGESRRLAAPFVQAAATAHTLPATRADGAPVEVQALLDVSRVRSRLDGADASELTPYVGRTRELETLAELLASARAGAGRLVVVVGEPGSGKSRLLHELRARARAAGVRPLLGGCDAYGGAPFRPFAQAAHELLELAGCADAGARHDRVVAAVGAIDASLEEFLPLYLALLAVPSERFPIPPQLQGEHLQAAMLEAITALLTVAARDAPTLLLLEDWHWADEGSRAACRHLAEVAAAYPLLVAVSARPEGAGDWGSAEHQTLLHLGPLDAGAAAAIIGAVLDAERVAPALLAELHERTGGNPFFLEEVGRALRESGGVRVRDGVAAPVDGSAPGQVPGTVQGVIHMRLDRLDPDARDVLRVASVVGREFTRGLVADAAGPEVDLARCLERLKGSGLVRQVGVVPEPAFRFKHALTEEVAYASLLEHQRAALHAAVGRAIERRYAGRLDEHVERLAHHFGRAEAWDAAVRYGLQAADRAGALSQHADALATLERVEQWALRLPADAARRDLHADVLLRQERLCEALGLRARQLRLVGELIERLAPHGPSPRLAQAYLRQGDACTLLRRFGPADRALETALRISREGGDAAGERNALRSLALLRTHEGRHGEALATVERVLAMGRAAGDTRAEAGDLATLANILRAMGDRDRALRVLEEALERTAPRDAPLRYGALLNVIGTVHRELGNLDTALDYFRRVREHGVDRRHPINASFTLPAIAHIHLARGRTEEALATYREAVELNRRARYADGLAHASRSLGEVLFGLGRLADALPHLREAAALFAQLEDRAGEALMRRRLAAAHERLDDAAAARDAWEAARRLCEAGGDAAGQAEALEGLARAGRRLGADPAAVEAQYAEALALAVRAGDRGRELALRNALGIVRWERGRYAEALREYEQALRLCRETGDRWHEGLVLNSQGATLHRLRRYDEARTVLEEAARANAAAGRPLLAAHARALQGEVCLALGRLDEARAHVEASLAARRELGDRRGEGWMLERLSRVLAAQSARDEARAAAAAARAIADEVGDAALHEALHEAPRDAPPPPPPNGPLTHAE